MNRQSISWKRAAIGALLAEVGQILASVLWVAFYSLLIVPGLPVAAYEAYAQASGPWVSILAGGAIFYAASRWIARNRATALALFGIFLLVDLALLLVMVAPGTALPYGLFALSYVSKGLLCHLGGQHAEAGDSRG